MADPRKYDAALARKGLAATGVTEDHARSMAASLGSATMLIVEARHTKVTTDAEGKTMVVLNAVNVEPVPSDLDERVREFQRALYRQRPEVLGQEALKGIEGGPSPKDAAAALDPDVWDGDLDAPLAAVPDAGPEDLAEWCPAPRCALPVDHDGDHDDGSGTAEGS